MLTDADIDRICLDLFQYRYDITYVSPPTLQAFMSRVRHRESKRIDLTTESVARALGGARYYHSDDTAKALVTFIHGPFTEEERSVDISPFHNSNIHWSLLIHFKDLATFYHYDSVRDCNSTRCGEVIRALRDYGIVPGVHPTWIEPEFFLQQISSWECAYYGLWVCKVIVFKGEPHPICHEDCWGKDGCSETFTNTHCEDWRAVIFQRGHTKLSPYIS